MLYVDRALGLESTCAVLETLELPLALPLPLALACPIIGATSLATLFAFRPVLDLSRDQRGVLRLTPLRALTSLLLQETPEL